MFQHFEQIVGVFVVLMAFLVFWSPILVFISIIIFIVFLILKSKYFKINSNVDPLKNKNRLKSTQLMTSDNRFGSNVRQMRSARRQLPDRSRPIDNYFSNYSLDSLTANQFLQSDGIFSSMSVQSFGSRPQSANDMSFTSQSLYRSSRESPMSQLGNMPFVKLMSSGSEPVTHEPKVRSSPAKPVTVRIAPMPQNLSKITLNRISNPNTSLVQTLGAMDTTSEAFNPSTDPKIVVDALKKSLRRKREPKNDNEIEDNLKMSTNKKQKKDSNESIKMSNGTISTNVSMNKTSTKRQANDMTELLNKRFKNNEILSSYSSLSSLQSFQMNKNKRKLSPNSNDSNESNQIKTKKSLIPEEEPKTNLNPNIIDEKQFRFIDTNDSTFSFRAVVEEPEKSVSKKSYGLPIHLHSMEDHERDRNKARHRLSRFLNAVKEVSSPTSDSSEGQLTVEKSDISSTSEIGLPLEPAAAIFTTSRVETSVTTTLLNNTPISSVLTSTKESLSPQTITIDTSEPSPINSLPVWPQSATPLFTAKPAPTTSLFSVGTGSTTRRIAQNSRLRSRQKR